MSQLVLADNVKETASYSGSGTVSLAGAYNSSVRSFVLGIGNGKRTAYKVDDGNGVWENRIGTIASGTPDQITNDAFISSSTGSPITFSAGTKTISCVPMPEVVLTPAVCAALAETSLASATTTDLGTVNTMLVAISGTATITGFGSQPYTLRKIRFTGTSLVLTHNATSLILPCGRNIQTGIGDTCEAISDASGNWRVFNYQRAAVPVEGSATAAGVVGGTTATIVTINVPPGRFKLSGNAMENGSGAGANLKLTAGLSGTTNSLTGTVNGKSKLTAPNYVNGGTETVGSVSFSGFEVSNAVSTNYFLVVVCQTNSDSFDGYLRADPII